MANAAQGNHRHPKKANAKAKKLVKHHKVAMGGTALRGDLVTHFMGGVSLHQVKPRVVKKVAKSQDDELTDAQIDAATARGEERARNEPRALSVEFDRVDRRIVIALANGAEFKFPPELAQGLGDATDDQLADVRVSGNGFGLHWDSLDADLTVPGVVSGVFGTRRFMAQQAGRSTSPAKAAAARENGAKGGRPRKPANPG
jgi:hypothetical protein